MAKAKWTLTDAAAKRIFAEYVSHERIHGCYDELKRAIKREGLRSHDCTRKVLAWIGKHYPQHLVPITDDLCYLYENLRDKVQSHMASFDSLSSEIQYKHYHYHERENDNDD